MGAPRDCAPSLVVVWPENTQPWVAGSVVRLVVTSERLYVKEGPSQTGAPIPGSLCGPTPPQEALQREQAVLVPSPVASLHLSPESLCTQGLVSALQDWSLCFPNPVEVL